MTFGGLSVERGDDDLGDVGDEHLTVGLPARLVPGHRAGARREETASRGTSFPEVPLEDRANVA